MLLSIFEQEWFLTILGAFAIGIAGLITWSFKLLEEWLRTKIKNEKIRKAMSEAFDVIDAAVKDIQQTFVDDLKKQGKFDKKSQTKALNNAANKALAMLSEEAKQQLKRNVGDLSTWLTTQVEAKVAELHKE